MNRKDAIKKLSDGSHCLCKDVDNIQLLNSILSECFPNKETRNSYEDNFFLGNQVEKRWLAGYNNRWPGIPIIKLSTIIQIVTVESAPISERMWSKGDEAVIENGQIRIGGNWFPFDERYKVTYL